MKKNKNQGFSLVELLLAIAILVIIMVAVASFMGTTTQVYTRTRNDIELQKSSQELYDLIADKLMQALEVRIGRDGKEYVCMGTNDSNYADVTGELMIKSNGILTPAGVSSGGYPLYDFNYMDESPEPIEYISIRYEYKDSNSGGMYREAIDTFYFKGNEVYFVRNKSATVRSNAVYNPNTGSGQDFVVSSSDDATSSSMDMTAYIDSSAVTEDDLICDNLVSVHAYAVTWEDAIYLTVNLEKQNIEQVAQGMITIRNDYVLQPAGEIEIIEVNTSTEDTSTGDTSDDSSTEATGDNSGSI